MTGLDAQPVHLHGLPPAATGTPLPAGTCAGTCVAAHVEQPRLDAGGGDPGAWPVRDQGRERHAERAREGVQRAKRRVADAILDLRERPLADVGRLGQRAEGQAAFLPRGAQPLTNQPGQVVHDDRS